MCVVRPIFRCLRGNFSSHRLEDSLRAKIIGAIPAPEGAQQGRVNRGGSTVG